MIAREHMRVGGRFEILPEIRQRVADRRASAGGLLLEKLGLSQMRIRISGRRVLRRPGRIAPAAVCVGLHICPSSCGVKPS